MPTDMSELRKMAYAIRDAEELAVRADALLEPPKGDLRRDLERAAGGELAGTTISTRKAVQYQTQLWVAAAYAHAGVRVRPLATGTVPTPDESPRVCWRLQLLRGWGHETGKEVLPRGAGAGGRAGVRAREWVRVAVGGHPVDGRKD